MKKLFVMILALMIAAPVTAFAAEDTITDANGSRNIDVQAKYTNGTTTPDVYSVDVTWGAMESLHPPIHGQYHIWLVSKRKHCYCNQPFQQEC